MTPRECHELCLEVAEIIDRDLAAFLRSNIPVAEILDELDAFKESMDERP
ncbi:hypothetical protein [Corynebacterium sp. MSK008]|nr:hypothetical protein [Corynebacterium sp. MSK008]MDK8880039.1 hypothetical protein [Corynebacterium sp. MSK008]